MSSEQPARLFIFNDTSNAGLDRVFWPTGRDKELFMQRGASEPLVHTSQLYFVNDLDVNPEMYKQMENFVHACQQYNFNVMQHDVRKSQSNWFHALMFNYELCEINEDLENCIQFVLNKYEPLKEIPNSEIQWTFIRKIFKMVLKHESLSLKIFLMFVLITWEPELAEIVRTLFTTEKGKTQFSKYLPHIRRLVDSFVVSPYTRNNINYLMEVFHYETLKLCCMGILPGIDVQLDLQRKEQAQKEQEEARLSAMQPTVNFDDMNL